MARVDDDRLRRWTEGALLGGVFLVLLVFLPASHDAFGLPKLLTATAAVVVGWAAWAAQRRPTWPQFGRVERATVAYVGIVAVATVVSVARYDSFFGSYERYGGLLPLLVYVAYGALVAVAFRGRPDRLALVPVVLAVAAGLLGAYMVLQTAGVDVVDWEEASGATVRYQAGSMGNSDFAGGFLGIAMPFVAVVATRRRLLGVTAGTLAVAGLVVSRSRGGVAAAVVGLVVLGIIERRRIPRVVHVAAAVGVVAVVAVVALRPGPVEESGFLRTESFEVRAREWAGAWHVFLERPVLGTGPDTFEFGFPEHRSREDGRELGLQIADKPHSILLEKATDTGVLGLAAYLAVLVTAFAAARRQAAVFAAGLAAYVAQGAVSIDVTPLALLGWVLIGAIVAASGTEVPASKRRRALRVPAAVGAAVGLGVLLVVLAADLAARDGEWNTAISRHPGQPFYRMGAAFDAERRGAFDEARTRYGEVLDMQPGNVLAFVGLARVETQARRFEAAERWWKRAVESDPQDWEMHNGYGLMLNSWSNATRGNRALRLRAAEQFEATLRIKPDHVPAQVNLAKIREALGVLED